MSAENINESSPIRIRRERRATIKLHKLARRQQSNKSEGPAEFLDNSVKTPPVFEAGDDISGVVGLVVKGGSPVAKVRLALVCLSQVRWHIYGKRKSVVSAIFSDMDPAKEHQIFFDRKQILQIDLGKGAQENKWADGKYEFPFRVTLPHEGLPSTMKSCHGFIKYTIEVFTVDDDQYESRGEKEIVVVAPIQEKFDLHGRSLEKSLNILGSGKITITGSLERKEYVSGELIPVEVTTVNDSNIAVQPRVSLYQTQVFACNQVHRTLETCLTAEPFIAPPVQPAHSVTQIIKVPLGSNLVVSLRSALITVKYFVHVTLDIPHSTDLSINLPFLVTTKRARAAGNMMIGHHRHPTNGSHGHLESVHSAACQTHPINMNPTKGRTRVNAV